jgi:hypothetical protein
VKLGRQGERIVLEAHPDRYGRDPDRMSHALARLAALGLLANVDPDALRRAVEESRGEPVAVGRFDRPAARGATSTPTS